MIFLLQWIISMLVVFSISVIAASENTVNVYTFSEEIPPFVIESFEKETGIKVNCSTFDTNEVMYTKLHANKNTSYDMIEPSSYYIDRMRHQGMLERLDKTRLSNFKNLDPAFLKPAYDPQNDFSIPFIWGVTGIFLNKNYFEKNHIIQLSDLYKKEFTNQLMFLDDAREVFSMALRMLSYSINDTNPGHIKEAYIKLKALMPNIRLFNSDAVRSILIDEDATAGMTWNGDLFKASYENKQLQFIYPQDGFEIWVDNFAILKHAPHKDNAYLFLNFLMRPDIAMAVSSYINYSTANLAARKLMPENIRNNIILYPSNTILKHGEFEIDTGEKTAALYEKYWELLKMGG